MATDNGDTTSVPKLGHYLGFSPNTIENALEHQSATAERKRLGEVLVELNAATHELVQAGVRAQRIDRLAAFSLFADLSVDDLVSLSEVFEELEVEAGEQFITQDTSDPFLYLVVSGRLDVFRLDESGMSTRLREVGAGEPVGEMGYFSGGIRSASVRAIERTLLLRARYSDLSRIFEQTPRLAMAFWQVVTQRLHDLSLEYEADHHRRLSAERSLEHLHEFLDLSETQALGAGIETVIESLVHAASSLMHADRASLFLLDRIGGELWSIVAEGEEIREIRLPIGSGLVGWVAEHRRLVNIPDAYADPRFNREVDKRTGYRTRNILCGPISNMQNELIGVVQVINKHGGTFDREDERLFRVFASQAAVAVENYFLYSKVMASHEQMAIMLDIARSLSESLDLPTIIRRIVAKMTQALRCERSSFFVFDRDSFELWSMQTHGSTVEEIRFPASTGLAGHSATSGDVVNVADAYDDPRFNQSVDKASGLRTRSVLCVPVLGRSGEVTGVVQVINKTAGAFDTGDETLLRAIASQIGVVLDNAQLYASTVEMKNYLESVQESISNGILTLDCDGRVVTANKAAAALFEDPDLAISAKSVHALLGDRNPYLSALIDRVYTSRTGVIEFDVELHRSTAGRGAVNVNIVPLTNESNGFQGLVLVLEDITQEMRVKSTLTRYLAKDLVERMLEDPTEQALGGIRSEATVLFSDIRGFTSIAERLSAEQTMDLLNEYFTLMVDEVIAEKGLLDKFMGDGLMAVFGVPYPQPDDATRAVRSALGMLRALRQFNRARRQGGLDILRIGIGIHSDEVISGNMGSAKRMEYTVIGDGVNLASRIEGLNKSYETSILVSGQTYDALNGGFAARLIDHVAVKGRSEPARVYEILGTTGYEPSPAVLAYEQGIRHYEQRAFQEALGWFQRGAETDGPCRTYVARCQRYIETPPPTDWDGVWQATLK